MGRRHDRREGDQVVRHGKKTKEKRKDTPKQTNKEKEAPAVVRGWRECAGGGERAELAGITAMKRAGAAETRRDTRDGSSVEGGGGEEKGRREKPQRRCVA